MTSRRGKNNAKKSGEGEAVQAYRQLLKLSAKPQKALSALVGLHAARKAYDRAYGAAQVLAHLAGGASQEELAVVSRLLQTMHVGATLLIGHAESLTGVTTRARAVQPTVYAPRGAPSTRICPCCTGKRPARCEISVVLPAPLGPSRPKNSPSSMSKLTPSSARTVPRAPV